MLEASSPLLFGGASGTWLSANPVASRHLQVSAAGAVSTSAFDGSFGTLTGTPTTLSGYGITDALPLAGGTLTGSLSFSGTSHAGLRLNNLTSAQVSALGSPAAGMVAWDTDLTRMRVYNGTSWTNGFVRLDGDTMTGTLTSIANNASYTGFQASTSASAAIGAHVQFVLAQNTSFMAAIRAAWRGGTAFSRINLEFYGSGGSSDPLLSLTGTANSQACALRSTTILAWASTLNPSTGTLDLQLHRGAADVLEQRRIENAQAFRLYGTSTDASNYRRLTVASTTAGVFSIRPEGAGTGASGNVLHISGLPTSNPGPGILWNNAGNVAIGT